QRDHDAHADTVAGLIVDLSDAGELAVPGQPRDRLDEVVRVDLVGQLGDHQDGTALDVFLDFHHGAHPNRAATGAVGVSDAVSADNQAPGGEIGTLDPLDEGGEQHVVIDVGVLQEVDHTGADLAQIVRRDVGGHPDRDPRTAVDQQVRDPRGQHRGHL